MADSMKVSSGTADPYTVQTYSAKSTDKNTLSITSYFKLLSAELANQDMSNPMDTSDMMNQMSQMAMVQSLTAMTESIRTSQTLSQQSYAAGMVGRTVDYTATDETTGRTVQRTGVVTGVNLSGDSPTVQIEGDAGTYSLSDIVAIRKSGDETGTGVPDSASLTRKAVQETEEETAETEETKKSEETAETEEAEKSEETAETGETKKSEETAETEETKKPEKTADLPAEEVKAAETAEQTGEIRDTSKSDSDASLTEESTEDTGDTVTA